MNGRNENESWRYGSLPSPAVLATAFVPMQRAAHPHYEADRALARGTLFPGLDLPFHDLVNSDLPSTPKTEMMSIDFVANELALYLDTHAEDEEAFELYQTVLALQKEARERYVRLCGPIAQSDQLGMESYEWLKDPWPWDYCGRRED